MNIEDYRNYCITKPGVTESFPFDKKVLVFKVMNKMFALADVEEFDFINLKCDPEKSLELRERYSGITPGFHMSKKHLNSVHMESDVGDDLVYELIDESYDLIVASLPKKLKEELKNF